jgi:hypothetical protein
MRSSNLADNRYKLPDADLSSPYSVFATAQPSKIMSGDYLIVLPTSLYGASAQVSKDILGDCSKSLLTSYDLLFCTESPYVFWRTDLLTILRGRQPTHDCNKDLNYYVLRHK